MGTSSLTHRAKLRNATHSQPARGSRDLIRRLRSADAETILSLFTDRQYVKPRESVAELLAHADTALGICPVVGKRAVQWLDLDPSAAIGRLRRTELTQLARCLHRFLRHTAPIGGSCST